MRIAVVDLVCIQGGGYSVLKSLFEYVVSGMSKDHKWLFIVSRQKFESNAYVKVIHFPNAASGYLQRVKTEWLEVNKVLNDFVPDIVLSMPNIRVFGCKWKQAVYMQQSLPFQKEKKFSFLKKEERSCAFRQHIQGLIIRKSLKKSEMVFVQTEWVKCALEECIRNRPIIKIGYLADQIGSSFAAQTKELNRAFFYPASPYIYKNHRAIFAAIKILRKKGYSLKVYLTLNLSDLGTGGNQYAELSDVIECIGQQSKAQMRELYARTTLVFPSYIETVGLPLAEARAAGAWIIASDCPFSHEVLEGYPNCEYFDPFNATQLADCMERVITGRVVWRSIPYTGDTNENCWDKMMMCLARESDTK